MTDNKINSDTTSEAYLAGAREAIAQRNRLLHERGTVIEEYFEAMDRSPLANMDGPEIERFVRGDREGSNVPPGKGKDRWND